MLELYHLIKRPLAPSHMFNNAYLKKGLENKNKNYKKNTKKRGSKTKSRGGNSKQKLHLKGLHVKLLKIPSSSKLVGQDIIPSHHDI
jgi:hypothetical protein